MKRGLLILFSLLLVSTVFAFNQGAMLVGGQAGLNISKANSDDDALTTITLAPEFGYFVINNLCVDAILAFGSQSKDEYSMSAIGIGLGGRYFFDKLYAGLDLQYQSETRDYDEFSGKFTVSSMYGTLKTGYLIPLTPSAFVDLRGNYRMGLGDYGADGSGKNESSDFGFTAGLQVLFGN
jgi:hypothetical protein